MKRVIKNNLKLWLKNKLISNKQYKDIDEFMKQRKREQFFRLLKWLKVLGVLWVIISLIAIFNTYFGHLFIFFSQLYSVAIKPILDVIFNYIPPKLFTGIIIMILGSITFYLDKNKEWKKGFNNNVKKLHLNKFQLDVLEKNRCLNYISYILLSFSFIFLNSDLVIKFPVFYVLGTIMFLVGAHYIKDTVALLFGVFFIALSVGMCSFYGFASYYLSVSQPSLQVLVSIIMLLVGYILYQKSEESDDWNDLASRTYNWSGLLFLFLSLWVMSIWGISKCEDYFYCNSNTVELFISNSMFVGASFIAMIYGSKAENKVFFNYGLTFMIIASYTIFFSHIWELASASIASLLFGVLLLTTGYLLKKHYIKKNNLIK